MSRNPEVPHIHAANGEWLDVAAKEATFQRKYSITFLYPIDTCKSPLHTESMRE